MKKLEDLVYDMKKIPDSKGLFWISRLKKDLETVPNIGKSKLDKIMNVIALSYVGELDLKKIDHPDKSQSTFVVQHLLLNPEVQEAGRVMVLVMIINFYSEAF